jgi:hypothetical protein
MLSPPLPLVRGGVWTSPWDVGVGRENEGQPTATSILHSFTTNTQLRWSLDSQHGARGSMGRRDLHPWWANSKVSCQPGFKTLHGGERACFDIRLAYREDMVHSTHPLPTHATRRSRTVYRDSGGGGGYYCNDDVRKKKPGVLSCLPSRPSDWAANVCSGPLSSFFP